MSKCPPVRAVSQTTGRPWSHGVTRRDVFSGGDLPTYCCVEMMNTGWDDQCARSLCAVGRTVNKLLDKCVWFAMRQDEVVK